MESYIHKIVESFGCKLEEVNEVEEIPNIVYEAPFSGWACGGLAQ